MRRDPDPNTMPQTRQRQTPGPTRLVHQAEAARIIGVRRQNLGRWAPFLEAEEHGGRLYFTRASCERVRAMRAERQSQKATPTATEAVA